MSPSPALHAAAFQGIGAPDIQRFHINLSVGSNVNRYPAKQHARKVASKLGISRGLIYLVGKPTVFLDDSDQTIPFRQRRYFYYLSGANEPDCHLTYDIAKDHLTLYVPDFDLRQTVWMGPTISIGEALDRYDIDNARYAGSLQTDISGWLRLRGDDSQIILLHPDHRPPIEYEQDLFETKNLVPAMNAARGVKDSYEIEMIRKANIVSGLAHTAVLEKIGQMTNESDIAGLFLETCMTHGAPDQAYGIIAASGENGATLHYMKNNEDFGNRLSVCLDAGAEYECYASDVTRTFPISRTGEWPTPEVRDIYLAVERMQEECIRLIKPGVRFRDVHLHASRVAVEELLKLGVFQKDNSVDAIMASGAVSVFFPHGLGHHVGLEVHDVAEQSVMAATDDSSPRTRVRGFLMQPASAMSAALLEESMIVTVEPGIYFNRLALKNARTLPIARFIDFDVVERYYPIGGVRIEDDILVTATGYENLTTAPKGEEALDIIRRSSVKSSRA
ncbi:peptidase D, putative [Talaromyces stipitatus ATCC 10500]|uniref:Probable Xaa-Pro aminopeptidase TSTA_094700 n=1 Tax=Talaromyces stipitatus (strain ATCC 10500 / CBS 375.48 / QM 6759 / NRRL 1006) TaxID=441959 RepID=AMPP2_TALSN|nr:peptidase D, putative [Talaromyces stipitatus ATCC 10500]B8M2W9.1 RecName: Full=Probable Xaa-Pro aminopeptidase TSTA_094700; AltName: Full=Aminoacylproline aminopeptidase; AltName: Full=Prolidase [Talaromyces stipitatus ATCC 10500]EED22224.1 peptidase D, putative [Talaromyces stipitatus ATCC 10500]